MIFWFWIIYGGLLIKEKVDCSVILILFVLVEWEIVWVIYLSIISFLNGLLYGLMFIGWMFLMDNNNVIVDFNII